MNDLLSHWKVSLAAIVGILYNHPIQLISFVSCLLFNEHHNQVAENDEGWLPMTRRMVVLLATLFAGREERRVLLLTAGPDRDLRMIRHHENGQVWGPLISPVSCCPQYRSVIWAPPSSVSITYCRLIISFEPGWVKYCRDSQPG